jgi:hypothetical protein
VGVSLREIRNIFLRDGKPEEAEKEKADHGH